VFILGVEGLLCEYHSQVSSDCLQRLVPEMCWVRC